MISNPHHNGDRRSVRAAIEPRASESASALDEARNRTPSGQMVAINAAAYGAMRQAAAPVADDWAAAASGKGLDGKALLEGARQLSSSAR